jgi:outer membrane protein OmpA-like peptidoglycan-associated protein/ABC-type taurine transport system substrate-binding protein
MSAKYMLGAGLVIGCIGLAAFLKFGKMEEREALTTASSDSTRYEETVTIYRDAFEGYRIACSDHMTKVLRRSKIRLECYDDGANYDERMKALKKGKANFAMVEVGAYVIEGEKYNYPASIIAGIDTSFGADVILSNKSKIPDLEALRNNPNVKIAVTLNSPSDVLLKTAGKHFDIAAFREESNLVSASSSEDAMKMLFRGEVDIAVVWEPEASKILGNPEYVSLLSTKEAQDTIVDALVVSRKYGEDKPQVVKKVLAAYFQTLKHYKDNESELIAEIKADSNLSEDSIKKLVSGINWINLNENCKRWFGCDPDDWSAQIKMVDALEKSHKLWLEYGLLPDKVFPKDDAYTLINSEFLADLQKTGISLYSNAELENPLEKEFDELTDSQWSNLKEFAKLKQRKILFVKNNQLRLTSREAIDELAKDLEHYPNYRLKIEGHTGTLGDANKNLGISESRGKWVKRYLVQTYNIDEDRIMTVGYGGTKPLKRKNGQGEFDRAYQSKLPRVAVILMQEEF